jgi:hypothetical protein
MDEVHQPMIEQDAGDGFGIGPAFAWIEAQQQNAS